MLRTRLIVIVVAIGSFIYFSPLLGYSEATQNSTFGALTPPEAIAQSLPWDVTFGGTLQAQQTSEDDWLRVLYRIPGSDATYTPAVWARVRPSGADYRRTCTHDPYSGEFVPLCQYSADLSPDGKRWITYVTHFNDMSNHSDDVYEVLVTDAQGRNPVTLLNPSSCCLYYWTWLSDSKHVLFWDDDAHELHLLSVDPPVVDTLLFSAPNRETRPAPPHVSGGLELLPDDSQVLFKFKEGGASDLMTVALDGSGTTNLTNSPGDEAGCSTWSPDGSRVAFDYTSPPVETATVLYDDVNARSGPGPNYEVITQFKAGVEMEVLERANGWTKLRYQENQEVWMFDDLLSFGHADPEVSVDVINHDGSERVTLGPGRRPTWSPSGHFVGFTCGGDWRQNQGICISNPDGSDRRVLITSDSERFSPVIWSPDSRRIAVISHQEDESANAVHIIDLDTGEDHLVFQDANEIGSGGACQPQEMLQWSPSSEWIQFGVDTGQSLRTFYICSLEGCELVDNIIKEAIHEDEVEIIISDWFPTDWLRLAK